MINIPWSYLYTESQTDDIEIRVKWQNYPRLGRVRLGRD